MKWIQYDEHMGKYSDIACQDKNAKKSLDEQFEQLFHYRVKVEKGDSMYGDEVTVSEHRYALSSVPGLKNQIIAGIVKGDMVVGAVVKDSNGHECYCFDSAHLRTEYQHRYYQGDCFLGSFRHEYWYIEVTSTH